MANNRYINSVIYDNTILMDISNTTATESDVISGEVFYKANGERSVGTLTVPQILYGTTGPTSSQGNDGDLYIKYEV